jgi:16S rRNA (guanine966-N2)-methyltransferase
VFVEKEKQAAGIIQANLATIGFTGQARVLRADVFIHLRNDPRTGFDYVHIAPPQYHNLWAATLTALDARPAWVNPDGVVVAQIDPREYTGLPLQHLKLVGQRRYGNTSLVFYERPGE